MTLYVNTASFKLCCTEICSEFEGLAQHAVNSLTVPNTSFEGVPMPKEALLYPPAPLL
jgi:hypothetical protein